MGFQTGSTSFCWVLHTAPATRQHGAAAVAAAACPAGHFTQLVWKSSTLLGCAAQVCTKGIDQSQPFFKKGTLVICRYDGPWLEPACLVEAACLKLRSNVAQLGVQQQQSIASSGAQDILPDIHTTCVRQMLTTSGNSPAAAAAAQH
jgi:hypothetical protein